jgi:glutamate racemase
LEAAEVPARHYLDSLLRKDSRIDTILLGCTHYALIEGMLRHWVPFQIGLVSQGAIVADKLTDYLRRHPDIEERLDRAGRETFLSTEYSPRIERLATQFFGRPVKIDAVRLAV